MKKLSAHFTLLFIFALLFSCCEKKSTELPVDDCTFTNPILDDGADPWVYLHTDGYYYCMVTKGNRLSLMRSASFTDLDSAEKMNIWFPPATGENSCCIWAPEIHYFDSCWYVYYTATDVDNPVDEARHVFVIRNTSANPFEGRWQSLGKVNTDYPGIDGHTFEYNGIRYFAYSPYIGSQSGIALAKMSSPTTLENQVVLGLPLYDWEKTPPREILEGPQFLEGPGDKLFLAYSAGACWDDNYGLGYFYADKESDLLDPASWSRSMVQVFEKSRDSMVFGPGHNCFTRSPDLTEDWLVYHAKSFSSTECADRSMRAQKFSWDEDGMPVFGPPLSINYKVDKPSGLTE